MPNVNGITIELKPKYRKLMCVYRINFDSLFYIGSTKNLKNRLIFFNSIFLGHKLSQPPKNIVAAITNCKIATVEIIEVVSDISILRHREDYYLKLNFHNELNINRSECAFSTKGVRWTKEEKESISKTLKGVKKTEQHRRNMSSKSKSTATTIAAPVKQSGKTRTWFCRQIGNKVFFEQKKP